MQMISLLCPSRGRPHRFAVMARSAFESARLPMLVEIEARLDGCDAERTRYPFIDGHSDRVRFSIGPRRPVPEAFNELASSASGEILGTAADDVVFRTEGWDERVRTALARWPDRLAIAVPADGAGRPRRATAWFATRELVDLLGWHHPPGYEHFYCDTHVVDVMTRAGRVEWLDDVLLEHAHPNLGKAPRDSTYAEKRRGPKGSRASDRDRARYLEAAASREREARLVLEAARG